MVSPQSGPEIVFAVRRDTFILEYIWYLEDYLVLGRLNKPFSLINFGKIQIHTCVHICNVYIYVYRNVYICVYTYAYTHT